MQQNKQARNALSRNDVRSRPPTRYQRPNSEKFQDRNTSDSIYGKSRSNSAHVKPEEFIEEFIEETEEQPQPKHKVGCPWQKSRSRTRYPSVNESPSGTMHPRPWGARNPKDIPCFCQMTRAQSRGSSNSLPMQKPTTQSIGSRPPGKSNKKISEIVDNFGIFLERRKIRLSENEATFLTKQIEERIQNFVDRPIKPTKQKQPDRKEPAKRQRNPLSLSPMQREQAIELPKPTLSRDRMMESQKSKMGGGQANFMGKMETKKCLLELTSKDQVPNNLRHILGTMSPAMIPADKMLFAVDDQQAYLSSVPDDYRQYTLKTINMEDYTGLQLHHQAANTTVLLAPNTRRGPMHQGQEQLVQSKAHQALMYNQSRRMLP